MRDGEHQRVERAAGFVAPHLLHRPRVGLVLGSGLGGFADELSDVVRIPYAEIPGMPRPLVAGHAGNLCSGFVAGVPVACLQGRSHLYEGHGQERAVFGARLLAELGCGVVLLTNAAGGIHARFEAGDLMLITDHLNLTGDNPLRGPTYAGGPRFPDLSHAYDLELLEFARESARASNVVLREGVYAAMLGPSYETPAEIRMLRALGADAVGMSTVPEVIALRQMAVRVGAMSCITNLAAGMTTQPLNHAEVEATARRSRSAFAGVLKRWIALAGTESA